MGDWWILLTKGQYCKKMFSSCRFPHYPHPLIFPRYISSSIFPAFILHRQDALLTAVNKSRWQPDDHTSLNCQLCWITNSYFPFHFKRICINVKCWIANLWCPFQNVHDTTRCCYNVPLWHRKIYHYIEYSNTMTETEHWPKFELIEDFYNKILARLCHISLYFPFPMLGKKYKYTVIPRNMSMADTLLCVVVVKYSSILPMYPMAWKSSLLALCEGNPPTWRLDTQQIDLLAQDLSMICIDLNIISMA